MELKYIEAFLKIAETRNFSTAAEELFITQSAISNRISRLEGYLNVRLFERNMGKIVKLTVEGEEILPVYRQAYDLIQGITYKYQGLGKSALKNLSVVYPVHLSDHFIFLKLFQVLKQSFPEHIFSFTILHSPKIFEKVREGKSNIGFVYSEKQLHHSNFTMHHILDIETTLAISPEHPLKDNILSLLDLAGKRLIIYHRSLLTYILMDRYFKQHNLGPLHLVEFQNFNLIKKMVFEDNEIAVLQRFVIEDELKNEALAELTLTQELPKTPFYLIAHKDVPSAIIKTIIQTARNLLQP